MEPDKTLLRSLFLELPAELRNLCYEHLFAVHNGCAQPNLLLTCRTIRREALDLFYSTHRFRIKHSGHARHLVKLVGARADDIQRLVCEVQVQHSFWGYSSWSASVDLWFTKVESGLWIGRFKRGDICQSDVGAMQSRLDDFNKLARPDIVSLVNSVPPRQVKLSLPL